MNLFVLWWAYRDHSDSGVFEVFESEEMADKLCSILNGEMTGKQWVVIPKELVTWKP